MAMDSPFLKKEKQKHSLRGEAAFEQKWQHLIVESS